MSLASRSECLDHLSHPLPADGALFVERLGAHAADALVPTRHHHCVDLVRHAHLAQVGVGVVADQLVYGLHAAHLS